MNMPLGHKKIGEKMNSFYTQANLAIEQASSEARTELKKILEEGFRYAEVTEILFEDVPNPQVNVNIYEKMNETSSTQFDKEILYMMERLLKIDLEVVVSLQLQDMNEEWFGAKIYGNQPSADCNTPSLLNFKTWSGEILDKEDEFYLDEITDLQEQFLEARIEFFKDLAKKQINENQIGEDFEKFKPAIDIIRAVPFPYPETDISWRDSDSPGMNAKFSGADYGDAKAWQVELIFDEILEIAMKMNVYDSLPIGKGSLITLIDQELITKPGNEAIMLGFSSYKLTLPSNINLVVVLFCEGEMDEEKFEEYEKYNIISPKTLDRGLSPSLFTELKSEFTKYLSQISHYEEAI